jgi:glycosyltransferase involved in cell wall biosynthesis
MDKIKILHVVGKMDPGGIETLLMNIYRNIDRERYEFHFAVQYEDKGFYDSEIEELGGRILIQPHPRKGLRAFREQFIGNVKNNGPYDAIHSHIFQFSGYVLKISKNLQVPVRICHSHTVLPGQRTTFLRNLYRRYMKSLILRNSTHMIGCSRLACESLFGDRCWQDARTELFPNAINLSLYEQLPLERSRLRQRIGVTDPSIQVIGHIGRFSEEKNHRFLLETFALYAEQQPNSQLVMVGEGKLRREMEELAEHLGVQDQVTFLGIRKDIPEIIGAFDLFLLPSLYEGLGMVVIEAQAGGVPSIVSDHVPPEANLQLDMVEHLKLQPQAWIDGIVGMMGRSHRPDWQTRHRSLQKHGYDIHTNIQRLEKIYHA